MKSNTLMKIIIALLTVLISVMAVGIFVLLPKIKILENSQSNVTVDKNNDKPIESESNIQTNQGNDSKPTYISDISIDKVVNAEKAEKLWFYKYHPEIPSFTNFLSSPSDENVKVSIAEQDTFITYIYDYPEISIDDLKRYEELLREYGFNNIDFMGELDSVLTKGAISIELNISTEPEPITNYPVGIQIYICDNSENATDFKKARDDIKASNIPLYVRDYEQEPEVAQEGDIDNTNDISNITIAEGQPNNQSNFEALAENLTTEENLQEYLKSQYGETVKTDIGEYQITYDVRFQTEISAFIYDIKVDLLFESGLPTDIKKYANSTNKEDRPKAVNADNQLKELISSIANDLCAKIPDKKICGSYYRFYGYEYEYIKENPITDRFYYWQNYQDLYYCQDRQMELGFSNWGSNEYKELSAKIDSLIDLSPIESYDTIKPTQNVYFMTLGKGDKNFLE